MDINEVSINRVHDGYVVLPEIRIAENFKEQDEYTVNITASYWELRLLDLFFVYGNPTQATYHVDIPLTQELVNKIRNIQTLLGVSEQQINALQKCIDDRCECGNC